jgi:hypothetical protein
MKTTTRRRPRHNSVARSARVSRTITSVTVSCSNDVTLGETSVRFHKFIGEYIAVVNLYGRSCSGVAATEAEAIEAARARCEELRG